MFTPRRTLLLLAGFLVFGAAYAVYAHLLGWLDGLPQLPPQMLKEGKSEFRPPPPNESPTQKRLADAFGPRAPETDYSFYPNQFSFINGDTVVVLASGAVPSEPKSKRVELSPFSLAVFGKPRPPHLRQPGEVAEITTVHSDKGVLEFDRTINNANDMRTAKLVRLELISDFDADVDPRRGMVHIVNNQRSADPNQHLVIRTVGPVFYRNAKAAAGTPAAQEPDLLTHAPVEIVDRQNLPRAVGAAAPTTAPAKSDEVRTSAAVEAILAGKRPPPPTVTGIGLRVYLDPPTPAGQPKPKRTGTGLHGLRRIELLEQVVVNLWVDNGGSVVGGPPPAAAPGAPESHKNPLALVPPPAALAAITGGLGPAAHTARLMNRALLQIDTRGPFGYDSEKSLARFDVVPQSDPNLANDVQVTKVPAQGGVSTLLSQVLELEFNGGATAANRPANAPAIKRVHAWTYTAGRFLSVAAQQEATEAYGKDLVHDQAASRTVLTGSPLYVVRERNVLTAGSPQREATLTTEPDPTAKPGPDRKSQMTVRGPGQIDMYDAASNSAGAKAMWLTSMVQSKETIDGVEQDLFTFTDGAKFEDPKADYWLKGNVLRLWLEPRTGGPINAQATNPKPPVGPPVPPKAGAPAPAAPQAASSKQPRPSHIQAVGQVSSHSADYEIDEKEPADQLNVFFTDAKPAPVVVAPVPPANPAVRPAPGAGPPAPTVGLPPSPMAVAAAPAPKEPEKPKPPYKIKAKVIDTWVSRAPAPPRPAIPVKPGDKAPPPKADEREAVKYQLDRARFEDNVVIHQDPEPGKPRGVDIYGRLVLIDGSADGNVMTVFGWPTRPGEVHQEEMSLLGPEIRLDQVHNAAHVKGRGALTMPTNSDFVGGELDRAEVVVIHWRDRMDFKGALRSAEFEGKVSARQGESWVLCHTMHVKFDRPVYFNQAQKKTAPPKPKDPKNPKAADDKPKIDTVFCYPAAGDAADDRRELYVSYNTVEFDKAGKMVKSQQLTAQEVRMFAQAQDLAGGEKFQKVEADGPGVLRVWQMGDRDPAGPAGGAKPGAPVTAAPPGAPKQPGAKPAGEQEMKLTVVTFSGRMTAIDKGKLFQQATFKDNIRAVSVPADSPTLDVQQHKLPPRAVLLTCNDKLVVWSHKKPNAPTAQKMDASGNAYLRSDDYDGWGETISHEGSRVTLTGSDKIPARIMQRFGRGTDQSGEEIIYDRATGSIKVNRSSGGTIGGPK